MSEPGCLRVGCRGGVCITVVRLVVVLIGCCMNQNNKIIKRQVNYQKH
jgi:hypothetical protein